MKKRGILMAYLTLQKITEEHAISRREVNRLLESRKIEFKFENNEMVLSERDVMSYLMSYEKRLEELAKIQQSLICYKDEFGEEWYNECSKAINSEITALEYDHARILYPDDNEEMDGI